MSTGAHQYAEESSLSYGVDARANRRSRRACAEPQCLVFDSSVSPFAECFQRFGGQPPPHLLRTTSPVTRPSPRQSVPFQVTDDWTGVKAWHFIPVCDMFSPVWYNPQEPFGLQSSTWGSQPHPQRTGVPPRPPTPDPTLVSRPGLCRLKLGATW